MAINITGDKNVYTKISDLESEILDIGSDILDIGLEISSLESDISDIESDKMNGPSSSVDSHIAVFDGVTGKIVKDSGYTIGASVPSNASFTDTKVTSAASNSNINCPILLNNGTSDTTNTALIKSSCFINPSTGTLVADYVYNAVWNDLTDRIPVDGECELEYGRVYCFDGNHYYKSDKYLADGIVGIHSDTGGFEMGHKEGVKELQCSVAGFVLAYVDKEYKPGTPLTCTCCGMLTEMHKQDKMEYPEKIVATYWKPETEKLWGSKDHKVEVNGRHWVKIK